MKEIKDVCYYFPQYNTSCLKRFKSTCKTTVDQFAGGINNKKYWTVSILNRRELAHRIVWILHYGDIPEGMVIDHIDGDKNNNLIENLRMVSQAVNSRNARMYGTNTSGVTGVTWVVQGNKTFVLSYYNYEPCKRHYKRLSVNELGLLEAFSAGVQFRKQGIETINSEDSYYTSRHGL